MTALHRNKQLQEIDRPRVSIIVISYNTRRLTLECIASIFEHTAVPFELIVMDNASSDRSADAIARVFPAERCAGVKLVRSCVNLGFARANNSAARLASGQYLLLLNPDTKLTTPAVDRVVKFLDNHPNIAVAGGRTTFADGALNPNSCHGSPTLWTLLCQATGLSALARRSRMLNPEGLGRWQRDSVREVDAVTGCFLAIHSQLWHSLGGFDTDFFMYGEDTDLCLRARRHPAGGPCAICPEAELIHYGGASEPVRSDKMVKLFAAKARLMDKHWPRALRPIGRQCLSTWAAGRAVVHWMLSPIRTSSKEAARQWRDLWHRRREFTRLENHHV